MVFADLVDFTVLSRQLDAEDTREVVSAYFARWQQAIEDQGGVVEKFIGDAVMAVFGLSRSFEDDAHRAVRAALAMLEDLDELNAELERAVRRTLQMRVGIDTGEVVVSTLGERAGGEFVAVGPTVNRASRLQSAAPVNRVLISGGHPRQVRGAFGIEERTGLQLKGIDEPVDALVVNYGAAGSGSGSSRPAGWRAWRPTRSGATCSCATCRTGSRTSSTSRGGASSRSWATPGVGKSRLLFDFDAWLAERPEPVWWFRGRASPSTQNGVNALLRDLLTSRLGHPDRRPRATRAQPAARRASSPRVGPEAGPRAARPRRRVARLRHRRRHASSCPTDPQALRDQGTEALGDYFRALGRAAPVVMLLEDLHWADEGTLRWLDAVAPILADTPGAGGRRPPGRRCWRPVRAGARGSRTTCGSTSHPLSRRESRELLRQILQPRRRLPAELVELVIDERRGQPVLHRGAGDLAGRGGRRRHAASRTGSWSTS